MNPVGVFGWDIVSGAKYVALASLASRILYAWHWVHMHPIIPINERLAKVVKPTGLNNLVIGERLQILGRYYFNPTCILVSLAFADIIEVVWFLGVIQGHWNICVGWFAIMASGIAIAIIEDQAPPTLSEMLIMYQMWVMFGYLTHWPHKPSLETA